MSKGIVVKQAKITDLFSKIPNSSFGICNAKNNENPQSESENKENCQKLNDVGLKSSENLPNNVSNEISKADAYRESLQNTLIDPTWRRLLIPEFKSEYMKSIWNFLANEQLKATKVFPPRDLIFNAFNLTPFHEIRLVLIGQDPYHNDKQAHGLCFSVPKGIMPPPSLKNIYKELLVEFPNFRVPTHGCLVPWAAQGVFMLNATLTVEAHKANSHSTIGWQKFTDTVIRLISKESRQGIVFLLWGGFAHKKEALIDKKKHVIIKSAHPSPLSYHRFKGSGCFKKTNEKLIELGREPIDWNCL